jgi:hypothetical protein
VEARRRISLPDERAARALRVGAFAAVVVGREVLERVACNTFAIAKVSMQFSEDVLDGLGRLDVLLLRGLDRRTFLNGVLVRDQAVRIAVGTALRLSLEEVRTSSFPPLRSCAEWLGRS